MLTEQMVPEAVRRAERAGADAAEVADHWTETYGIHVRREQHVQLGADLKTFLTGCQATSRHGIVMTDPAASLSPFVVQALCDQGGHWVLYGGGGGPIIDARTGATLSCYEELWWPERPELVGAPSASTPVLGFEIHAEHRAEERTRIGDLVVDALPIFGGTVPDRWGLVEPLDREFSRGAITSLAREQMPDTDPIYVSDAVGSYADLTVSRIDTGLRERVRGGVARRCDTATAANALAALAETRHRIVIATVAEIVIDEGPRWHPGPHHPERMMAAYLGPAALGRAGLDPVEVADRCGGTVVGRTQLPGVAVTFAGSIEDRFATYLAVANDVTGSHA